MKTKIGMLLIAMCMSAMAFAQKPIEKTRVKKNFMCWLSFRIRRVPVCMSGIRVLIRHWTLFRARRECRALTYCIR